MIIKADPAPMQTELKLNHTKGNGAAWLPIRETVTNSLFYGLFLDSYCIERIGDPAGEEVAT